MTTYTNLAIGCRLLNINTTHGSEDCHPIASCLGSRKILKLTVTIITMEEISSDNSELVTQFCNVTGVDAGRAKFFLESSAWKINVICLFY